MADSAVNFPVIPVAATSLLSYSSRTHLRPQRIFQCALICGAACGLAQAAVFGVEIARHWQGWLNFTWEQYASGFFFLALLAFSIVCVWATRRPEASLILRLACRLVILAIIAVTGIILFRNLSSVYAYDPQGRIGRLLDKLTSMLWEIFLPVIILQLSRQFSNPSEEAEPLAASNGLHVSEVHPASLRAIRIVAVTSLVLFILCALRDIQYWKFYLVPPDEVPWNATENFLRQLRYYCTATHLLAYVAIILGAVFALATSGRARLLAITGAGIEALAALVTFLCDMREFSTLLSSYRSRAVTLTSGLQTDFATFLATSTLTLLLSLSIALVIILTNWRTSPRQAAYNRVS